MLMQDKQWGISNSGIILHVSHNGSFASLIELDVKYLIMRVYKKDNTIKCYKSTHL
jgi:hypothetical protein